MSGRRNFLIQSTLAGCAFTFSKPLTAIADVLQAPMVLPGKSRLLILHSATTVKNMAVKNLHILHMGEHVNNETITDALLPYVSTVKGAVKVGIITLNRAEKNNQQLVNTTAAFLKKQQKCDFIICNCEDDTTLTEKNFGAEKALAGTSVHVDMILCRKDKTMPYHTYVMHNNAGKEVLINTARGNADNVSGTLDITFNYLNEKVNVRMHNDSIV